MVYVYMDEIAREHLSLTISTPDHGTSYFQSWRTIISTPYFHFSKLYSQNHSLNFLVHRYTFARENLQARTFSGASSSHNFSPLFLRPLSSEMFSRKMFPVFCPVFSKEIISTSYPSASVCKTGVVFASILEQTRFSIIFLVSLRFVIGVSSNS